MIIYLVKNKTNGKCYIGQTIGTLNRRINQHFNSNRQDYFHKALRKYGRNSFEWSVLETTNDIETLNQLEKSYIAEYGTLTPNGYNLATGGSNSRHNEITRKTLSELATAQWTQEDSRTKILNAIRLSPKAIEARKTNGAARKGSTHSQESKEKMSLAHQNISSETRLKMSESAKMRDPMPDEVKQKISNTLKGRPRSEETKSKISESRLRNRSKNEVREA